MSGLRVLITNGTLRTRTGTEINVRDLALGLLARGHAPLVYSPDLGEIAQEIRNATVPVVDDLRGIGVPPDVIHGHHHPETMAALLQFPSVPAIYVSHDFLAWHDAPPAFPRILRYIAVDDTNRDRLASEAGVPPERIGVVLNAVDLTRFQPRPPLPTRPERALLFSNYAHERTHAEVVREACRRVGLSLDVVGAAAGASSPAPETLLSQYDLVFAKARCALEALAVGAAVVLVDYAGSGPMVTTTELDRLRRLNFGRRLLHPPLDAERIVREIARYDAADAHEVSRRIRASAGLGQQLDTLVALYHEVIAENRAQPTDLAAEERTVAAYLRQWGPRVRSERAQLASEVERERQENLHLHAEIDSLTTRLTTLERDRGALAARLTDVDKERHRLHADLDYLVNTATWRARNFVLRSRAMVALYRAAKWMAGRGVRDAAKLHAAIPDEGRRT